MLTDSSATLETLRERVREFVAERGWEKFHAPKNIAMALAIEAAELMEHFQWISVEQSLEVAQDRERVQAIGEEVADVFCYTLAIANALGLDLAQAFERKMAKNALKYPVEQIHGRWGHADPSPVTESSTSGANQGNAATGAEEASHGD